MYNILTLDCRSNEVHLLCALLFFSACRLSEQSRLVAEQKRLVTELRGKYEEAQQWNLKYKVCLPHSVGGV